MDNKHIKWVDVLKGIGIIFVVVGHSSIPENIIGYIFTFHMPLFFFLSGYLFSIEKHPTFNPFFIKKCKTLLIPYISFSFVSILVSVIFINLCLHGNIKITRYLIEAVVSTRNKVTYNAPLWFLTSLFCVEIMYYFMRKYISNKSLLIILTLILSIIGFKTLGNPKLPWTFDSSLYYLVYYVMGSLMSEKEKATDNLSITKQLIILIFLIININNIYNLFSFKNTYLVFLHGYFANSLVPAILGFTFYILIAQKLTASRILSYLGKNSLIIMSLHFVNFKILTSINNFTFHLPKSTFLGIMFTLITLLVLVPVINFTNRCLPFILGKNIQSEHHTNVSA